LSSRPDFRDPRDFGQVEVLEILDDRPIVRRRLEGRLFRSQAGEGLDHRVPGTLYRSDQLTYHFISSHPHSPVAVIERLDALVMSNVSNHVPAPFMAGAMSSPR
jgi:hypothetical protein